MDISRKIHGSGTIFRRPIASTHDAYPVTPMRNRSDIIISRRKSVAIIDRSIKRLSAKVASGNGIRHPGKSKAFDYLTKYVTKVRNVSSSVDGLQGILICENSMGRKYMRLLVLRNVIRKSKFTFDRKDSAGCCRITTAFLPTLKDGVSCR